MKIQVVTPIVTNDLAPTQAYVSAVMGPEHQVAVTAIERGPASIECEYDEALAAPEVLARIVAAARKRCDAVVLDCFLDPGMQAARELVDIPVVGPGEASMHLAAQLGHRFSVVTVLERLVPIIRDRAAVYGVADKLASVLAVQIPVLDLHTQGDLLDEALRRESMLAVEQDGAHAIVLGCTGMAGVADRLQAGLSQAGYQIPVIDPIVAALRMAELWVHINLKHSKRTWPYPPIKARPGYE